MTEVAIAGPYGTVRRAYRGLMQMFHIASVLAILVIALIVSADVIGRGFFNVPLRGTPEIVSNTLVGLVFLQLPFAIMTYSMIRATPLYDKVSRVGQQLIETVTCLIGIGICAALAYGNWGPMWDAIAINAYEGEGALRVPIWPVRIVLVAMSALASVAYLFHLLDAWIIGPSHDTGGH